MSSIEVSDAVRDHHRQAERCRRAGGRALAVRVRGGLDADGGQSDGSRQRLAEELDGQVALGDVAQHAGHDPVALEGVAVLAIRVARAGRRIDVIGRRLGHRLLGRRLQIGPGHGQLGLLAREPLEVDRAVMVAVKRHGVRHLT